MTDIFTFVGTFLLALCVWLGGLAVCLKSNYRPNVYAFWWSMSACFAYAGMALYVLTDKGALQWGVYCAAPVIPAAVVAFTSVVDTLSEGQ